MQNASREPIIEETWQKRLETVAYQLLLEVEDQKLLQTITIVGTGYKVLFVPPVANTSD